MEEVADFWNVFSALSQISLETLYTFRKFFPIPSTLHTVLTKILLSDVLFLDSRCCNAKCSVPLQNATNIQDPEKQPRLRKFKTPISKTHTFLLKVTTNYVHLSKHVQGVILFVIVPSSVKKKIG